MSSNIDKKGSLRHERSPRELSSDYFKLDNRSIEDMVSETAELAKCVHFYNEENKKDSNWKEFFELIYDYENNRLNTDVITEMEKNGQMPPHLALYFAFLKIFNIAQDELNRITQRHLEYYFNNILKFERKKEVPDQAYLFFEINNKENKVPIAKNTLFDGGIDEGGKKRLYASDFDIIANKIQVSQIKSFTSEKNNKRISFFTQDGKYEKTTPIGFAISAPTLYQKDGERNIKLNFNQSAANIRDNFIVEYTGPEGWVQIDEKENNTESKYPKQLQSKSSLSTLLKTEIRTKKTTGYKGSNNQQLSITIAKDFPPLVGYSEDIHQMQLSAKDPVIRILLSEGSCDIQDLHKLMLTNIEVSVKESRDLLLYNHLGKINPEIPFLPFGPNPTPGASHFFIGNNKIFNKYLTNFKFNVGWKGCPIDFEKHYQTYTNGLELLRGNNETTIRTFNKDFKISGNLHYLDRGEWKKWNKSKIGIGDTVETETAELKLNNRGDDIRETVTEYSQQTKNGFIKYVSDVDYGHAIYNTLLTKVLMKNSLMLQEKISEKIQGEIKELTLPEKPYTPEIESFSINYKTKLEVTDSQLFSINYFKNNELAKEPENVSLAQLLNLENIEDVTGKTIHVKTYYFELENVHSASELNIYFEITNLAPFDIEKDKQTWSYFNGERWKEFPDNGIVRNTTDNLDKSGLISFMIQEQNPISDNGKAWIRLIIRREENSQFPEILSAKNNCVTATFKDNDNNLSHLKLGLPEATIQKFVEQNPKIKSVTQPYPSLGGKKIENDSDFYARISERLRHKNRAATCWDYERLTLEKFPQINFAMCLPHCSLERTGNNILLSSAPGNVLLLLSPNTTILKQENPLQPTVHIQMLEEIRRFLQEQCSPHVKVSVKNFIYKVINVRCEVQLKKGYSDISFYRDKLNTDLKNFIAPWIVANEASPNTPSLQSRNVSDIYYFLENLEYIDFVVKAEAKIVQKDDKEANENEESQEEIYTIADRTISKEKYEVFTSAENHDITISNG